MIHSLRIMRMYDTYLQLYIPYMRAYIHILHTHTHTCSGTCVHTTTGGPMADDAPFHLRPSALLLLSSANGRPAKVCVCVCVCVCVTSLVSPVSHLISGRYR
jgi:hypothetical protein